MENKPEKRIFGVGGNLLGILLLGIALRFLYLGRHSVWIDEGYSWLVVQTSFGELTRLCWTDTHPSIITCSFWAVQSKDPWHLLRITRPVVRTRKEPVTTCDEADLQAVSDLYTFGDAPEIRTNRIHWPSCLLTKKIRVFEQSRWHPLDE